MNIYRIAGGKKISNWLLSRIWSQIEETLKFVCVQTHRGLCVCRYRDRAVENPEWCVCTDPVVCVCVQVCTHSCRINPIYHLSISQKGLCSFTAAQEPPLIWELLPVVGSCFGSFVSCAYRAMITQVYFCITRMFKPSSSVKLVFCFAFPKWNPPWKS